MRRYLLHPLAPLVAYSAFLALCWVAYVLYDAAPAPAIQFALAYIWALLSLWWITTDARRHDRTPCFDFGFLCLVYYPLSLPWYCFWSRGWRGLSTLLLLASLWALPVVFASLVSAVFWKGV
jgi:hypothetical protein